ncbi:hypothetical protein LV716_11240 [Flagellimonas sp. HMM57]|uniref:hypothetical protein n=1 Tax=unclassified Flagellimonas TaxID=2644544 RepID=UPI0013D27E50|nr:MULTISPECIES: hypothetical protein [unclassified Flagellimonas]UII74839.1 hypothetical protein LV716_11240 [Flagellimonas sp. HMM57]
MKYQTFTLTAVMIVFMSISLQAMKSNALVEEFDINKVVFIEEDQDYDLGFDTSKYLPEGFDAYSNEYSVETVNYIDVCDDVELGFETTGYLPEGFNPYIR